MWWWRKVTRAKISPDLRKEFELYGETVIALPISNPDIPSGIGPVASLLRSNFSAARDWLSEQRDIHARREHRLETVEWAILIAVIVGVLADLAIVTHETGVWPK